MKFLETVTFLGNDALVPIDRIKFISWTGTPNGSEIKIVSDDGDWVECFTAEQKAQKRYDQIKEIIKGK